MAYGIIALVMALLGALFAITSRKKAPVDEAGNKVLKLSIGYGIVGIFCLLIFLSIIVLDISWIWTSKEKEIDAAVIVVQIFLFLFFGGIGIGLVLATWLAKITYNEDVIICKTWLGSIKTIKWTDVKRVE